MNEEMKKIKIGDEFICMSNNGLCSIGSVKKVWGITNNSINFQPCLTSWQSLDEFLKKPFAFKKSSPTKEILAFQKKFKEVRKNNKILLSEQKKFLTNRNF